MVPQTATANAFFRMHRRAANLLPFVTLKDGRYLLSGCPTGGSETTYNIYLSYTDTHNQSVMFYDTGSGCEVDIHDSIEGQDKTNIFCRISVQSGTTIPAGGLVFKPMIRLASDSDSTWVPYTMTNTQITNEVNTYTRSITGNPLSFNTDSEQIAKNTTITFEPIQVGSGDPSPTNVRDISGYNEITINGVRKNIWDKGNISGTKYLVIPVYIPSGTYTISTVITSSDTDSSDSRINATYVDNTQEAIYFTRNTRISQTVTFIKDIRAFTFYASNNSANSSGDTFTFADIQIEVGSTATEYEPYNTFLDIDIPLFETIYKGTLNVENGELTVTYKAVDMGDLSWEIIQPGQPGQYFRGTILDKDKKYGTSNLYCEVYKPSSSQSPLTIYGSRSSSYPYQVLVFETNYSTTPDFYTSVAGKKIVYELDTPITYNLTPSQIRLLQDTNVVTTNGTTISLTYRNGKVAKLDDLNEIGESINTLADKAQSIDAIVNVYGSKNLLVYPYYDSTVVRNGITYTDLGNGKIFVGSASSAQTATGTANIWFSNVISATHKSETFLRNGSYIIGINKIFSHFDVALYNPSTGSFGNISRAKLYDINDISYYLFTIEGDYYNSDGAYVQVAVGFVNGATVPAGGVTIEPMIRDARIKDDTFVPYAPTNRELMSYKANGKLGAKNFLAGTFTSGTNNGIVYTVNSDNSVNISGTVSSAGYSLLQSSNFILKPGSYTISKNPFVRGLSGSPKYSVISIYNVTAGSEIKSLYSEDYTFTITSEITVWIRLTLYTANTAYSGTFYPMIRITEDTDDTYQPYAMTNRELTDKKISFPLYESNSLTYAPTSTTLYMATKKCMIDIMVNVSAAPYDIPYTNILVNGKVVIALNVKGLSQGYHQMAQLYLKIGDVLTTSGNLPTGAGWLLFVNYCE